MKTTLLPMLHSTPAKTLLALLTLSLIAAAPVHGQAVAQPSAEPTTAAAKKATLLTDSAPSTKTDKDVVELSPFTVKSEKDTGYFAENTLAGSRINTNLADLASSITVVTKQQMEDTASVDINDVFKYEANTEGSSSYSPSIVDRNTVKDSISGYSFGNDGTTTTNAQSNRIRGSPPRCRDQQFFDQQPHPLRRLQCPVDRDHARTQLPAVRSRHARRSRQPDRRPGGAEPRPQRGQRPDRQQRILPHESVPEPFARGRQTGGLRRVPL
jgi:hypothetical protein